jgi:hypothetical protein
MYMDMISMPALFFAAYACIGFFLCHKLLRMLRPAYLLNEGSGGDDLEMRVGLTMQEAKANQSCMEVLDRACDYC